MARDGSFHCELEKSKDKDENGQQVTTVKCRGELVCGTAGELKERVRPLIPLGGRIIIDLGDVKHLDSASLGALVGLKVSAINHRAGQAHWLALAVSKFWTSTGRVTGKPEVIPR